MASAGKLTVLKLAVLPDPSAITPLLQFKELVQLPPLRFVQVPLAACASMAQAQQAAKNTCTGETLIVGRIATLACYSGVLTNVLSN